MYPTTTVSTRSAVGLLWRKSILLNMRLIIVYAAMIIVYLGWWAHTASRPTPYLVIGSIIVALLPATILGKDHKDGGLRLTCSLPVTRRTIVTANLSLAWLMSLAGIVSLFGIPIIVGVGRVEAGHLLTGGNLLLVLAVLTLASLFIHPSLIRFGPIGLVLGGAAAQVLGTVVFILTATGVIRGGFRSLTGGIYDSVHGLKDALGDAGFSCAFVMALALVNALTYLLSVHLYERLDA